MKHGSLFSGIGGFDLAAEWMGWENVFHCEWNEFGQKVLKYYWPNAESFGDITKTDFTKYHGTIDIISGGFPCQPYSHAGKRKGTEDERHLWPEMLRAIREVQPRWVVGENVRGLITWNGGLVFDEVQADLEAAGYEVLPFLLPAAGVNAPHERYRIWFVAYAGLFGQKKRQFEPVGFKQLREERTSTDPTSDRRIGTGQGIEVEEGLQLRQEQSGQLAGRFERLRIQRDVADTTGIRQPGKKHRETKPRWIAEKSIRNDWSNFPTQSPVCSRNDGISTELAGITFSKHRNESIKAYGNAIVPQVVYQIFKSINEYKKSFNIF
jgi:DNA (cytosine-5)-methyltransferase 1